MTGEGFKIALNRLSMKGEGGRGGGRGGGRPGWIEAH